MAITDGLFVVMATGSVMALFLIGIASSELESPVPVTIPIPTSIDRLLRTVPTEKSGAD
jgi:hypothetical protein